MKTYDVLILGAGSAGLSAKQQVAHRTQNYLVVDQGPLGTTCARVGCMPSKAFIEVTELFGAARILKKAGLNPAPLRTADTKKIMNHVRSLRDRFVRGVLKDMKSWQKTHFKKAKAQIMGQVDGFIHVNLNGKELVRCQKLILATGTKNRCPEIVGKDGKAPRLLNNENFFEQTDLPKKISVLGLGAIGLELADGMARLGVQVEAVGDTKRIAALTDPELVKTAQKIFKKRFQIHNDLVKKIELKKTTVELHLKRTKLNTGKTLIALGREPAFKELGIESLGIKLDEKGRPPFDPEHFQIPGYEVYIIGDANGVRPLLHEAVDQGRYVGALCMGQRPESFHPKTALKICFTSPQIAVVGKSYAELKEAQAKFVEGSVSFETQGRSLTKLKNEGKLKVYACPTSGLILGSEMIGPEAEHLAHLLAWSMDDSLKVKDLLRKSYYHPSVEEGLRTALKGALKKIEEKTDEADDALREEPLAGTRCP